MDKLVHTPEGKLVIDDPFMREGTKFKYCTESDTYKGEAVVTKESIEVAKRRATSVDSTTTAVTFTSGIWRGRTLSCHKRSLTLIP